ncbi:MAG: AsmA family rane protein [Gammaproteobacteria bacterium]|nr:AsmA family rane protein [Gammaproteobacteria bacterium]
MEAFWDARGWLKLTLRMVAVLVALAAVLVVAGLIFSRHLRGPAIRYVETHSGRQVRVGGKFDVELFSLHPRIVAERVTIGNPPWMSSGITAEIGHLSLTFDWGALALPRLGIRRLEMEQATLYLARDENLRANWQSHDPVTSGLGTGPPLIRSLSLPDARVYLDDGRRHLKFDGTVSAQDLPGDSSRPPLRIEGAGELNGRQANFTVNGDPLATLEREQPYRFEFVEESSGSRITGKGVIPHPFNFQMLEATFEASGEDMKDLYFLTGLKLLDTGTYRLSGKFSRQGLRMQFANLDATSGRSDVRGTVSIDISLSPPSHVEADLRSQLLRVSDLGRRAAGRASKPAEGQRLLPDTPFPLTGVRRSDTVVNFHAQALDAGPVALRTVAAKVSVDHGSITVAPLSAALREGKITGELKFDATREAPAAEVDLRATNLKLAQFERGHGQPPGEETGGDARPPPLDGPLQARISLKGHGNSIHELASNAKGKVTAVLPQGAVRSSLAELAGFDLRGLGLMATGNKEDTAIRCGVASFDAQDGRLTARTLLIDTEPVVITGEGTIDLASETLDLRFQGRPKHPRLRVRAPLLVRGPLRHPSFSIDPRKPAAQAGGAIALGMLLTPVAALLAFVDPGLAKDADCAALLAQARSGGK